MRAHGPLQCTPMLGGRPLREVTRQGLGGPALKRERMPVQPRGRQTGGRLYIAEVLREWLGGDCECIPTS